MGNANLRDLLDTFLHPNLRPRISSLTLRRTVTEGDTETLLVEPREPHTLVNTSMFERATFSLLALPGCLPIPQHLTVLEIDFPTDAKYKDLFVNVLRTIHSSLQSLRLVGSTSGTLYREDTFKAEAMMPIVFPYLQELALDYLDVIDMFALLNILECVSLDSLAIRQLRAWKYFPVHPTNNESIPQGTFRRGSYSKVSSIIAICLRARTLLQGGRFCASIYIFTEGSMD